MILRSMTVALCCGVWTRPKPYRARRVHAVMAGALRRGPRTSGAGEVREDYEAREAGDAAGAQERFDAARMGAQIGVSGAAGLGGARGVRVVAGAAELTAVPGPAGLLALFGAAAAGGAESVADLVAAHILRFDDQALIAQAHDWRLLARPDQLPPEGDWRTWLMMGGRGSGKTRAGAEWVHALATGEIGGLGRDGRIALVAETFGDAREVMIDGVSGILGVARDQRPAFEATRRRLVWPSGAVAQMFSSEDPESLRGPQFDLAWCDELGKWRHARETWDMLQFALRLGTAPRQLVTTTPRATPLMLALVKDPATRVTRIRTEDNAAHLAAGFLEAIRARYGGTRLGRQELDGELIADREDGLWRRDQIEALTVRNHGLLSRIVVAVDPPASGEAKYSCCGIVVAGLGPDGRAVVLADGSVEGASPTGWAEAVVRLYRRFDADCVVAEINQGGDMVTSVLRTVEPSLPVKTVRATRGKWLRAEPVAALYEQGRVVHAGHFASLEDQMCDFGPDGLSSGRSPDRLDALVWALTELVLGRRSEPQVRHL